MDRDEGTWFRRALSGRIQRAVGLALGGAMLAGDLWSCADQAVQRNDAGTPPRPDAGHATHPREAGPPVTRRDASTRDSARDTGIAKDAQADRVDAAEASRADASDASSSDGAADGAPDVSNLVATTECFSWPHPPVDDAAVAALDGGDAGPDAGADVDAGPCPRDASVALQIFLNEGCPRGFQPFQIVTGPSPRAPSDECCYLAYVEICGPVGRPFVTDTGERVAPVERRDSGWCAKERPDVSDLLPSERALLARLWSEEAVLEHASIASFGRFSMELLAVGAPPELLSAAHAAAMDEVRHAEICFAMASAYGGEPCAPGPFPFGEKLRLRQSLAEVAAAAAAEGCVGETIAAVVASERATQAEDPVVKRALAAIVDDEARHAELAWRAVAWAIRTGGASVKRAVERSFLAALSASPPASTACADGRHGWLDDEARSRTVLRAIQEVVLPSMRALGMVTRQAETCA